MFAASCTADAAQLNLSSSLAKSREVERSREGSSRQTGSKDNFAIAATALILLRRRIELRGQTVKTVKHNSYLTQQNGGRSAIIVCLTHRKCTFKAHLWRCAFLPAPKMHSHVKICVENCAEKRENASNESENKCF